MASLAEKLKAERERREALAAAEAARKEGGIRERATALTQGATFNWGDEITSAIAAAAAKPRALINSLGRMRMGLPADKEYTEAYKDIHQAENERQNEWRDNNPYESFGLEMGGALTTGGMGLRRALQATGGKSLFAGSKWRTVPVGGGVVAVESGLAGAGAAEPGDRVEGAKLGAALGVGTAGVLKTAGLLKGLTKNKVAQELGRGEDFIPLNVADDGWRGWLTRDFLGRTVGGEEVIRAQTDRVAQRSAAEAARMQEKVAALPNRFAQEEASIKTRIQQESARRAAARKAAMEESKEAARAIKESVPEVKPEQIPLPDVSPVRRQMIRQSIPDAGVAQQAEQMPTLQAKDAAKEWWRQNGFADIKARTFGWTDELISELEARVKERPELVLELGDVGQRIVNNAGKLGVQKGEPISGDALMALRNVFARPSNVTRQGFKKGSLREVVNKFDSAIEGQLDDEAAAAFKAERTAYKNFVTLEKAVEKAFVESSGEFTPKQGLAAVKAVYGPTAKATFYDELSSLRDAGKATKEAQEIANESAKAAQKQANKQARNESASVLKKARAVRDEQAAKDAADLNKLQRREVLKLAKESKTTDAKARIDKAKERVAAIAQRAPAANQSGLTKAFTTAALLSPLGFLGAPGIVSGIALGSNIARGLASQPSQRFIAGQTAAQKRMAELLRKREKEMEAAYRGIYRTSADTGSQ